MSNLGPSHFISLKDENWISRQRIAGKCVGKVLRTLNKLVKAGGVNLKDLENEAQKIITEHDCTPTFHGYKGFPGILCLSVNQQLVHGIPVDYNLQDGDVVKFDVGATYQGAIADAAYTAIVGKPKTETHVRLIDETKKALMSGIQAAKVGNRLGQIGYAIHKSVSKTEFGLIVDYGGHGLDENVPHTEPFVSNKSQPNQGVRLQAGMTLALEPMLTIGGTQTQVGKDGWTVTTPGIGSHMEHTIFIHPDRVEIMTDWHEEDI